MGLQEGLYTRITTRLYCKAIVAVTTMKRLKRFQDDEAADPGIVAAALPPCPPGTVSPGSPSMDSLPLLRDLPMFKEVGPDGKPLAPGPPMAPFPCREGPPGPPPGPAPGSVEGNVWNLPIPFCEDEMKPGDPVEEFGGDENEIDRDLPMFDAVKRHKRDELPWLKIIGNAGNEMGGERKYRMCISKQMIMSMWNKSFDLARHVMNNHGKDKQPWWKKTKDHLSGWFNRGGN